MNLKRPPTSLLIALLVFVGSCLGLTIYLWIAFGGPIPLKPESYRMRVEFKDSQSLVASADVRIAGIDVGKVQSVTVDKDENITVAELELDDEYAPRPADTQATIRLKTFIGEPYVALSPGTPDSPTLPDGGTLPPGQVAESVGVADILNTLDEPTRQALTTWLGEQGAAMQDTGPALSFALSQVEPLVSESGDVLDVMHEQDEDVAALVRDGGASLQAMTERQGQLRSLVDGSSRAFRAIASRDAELAETIKVLPAFLRELRTTSTRVADWSEDTMPLVDQLRPAIHTLAPGLNDLWMSGPDIRRALKGLKPLTKSTKEGIPALERLLLVDSPPLLDRATPWFGDVVPILNYANSYRRDVGGLVGNAAATTQATLPPLAGGTPLHYIRASVPINAESLTPFPQRFGTSQTNPYPKPGSALELPSGLAQFGSYLCVNRPLPSLDPSLAQDIQDAVNDSYYRDLPTNPVKYGPPCRDSGPLGPVVGGGSGYYPQLQPLP